MKPVARTLCSLLSWPLWPDIEISNPQRPLGGEKSRKYIVIGSECLRMRISTSYITNTDKSLQLEQQLHPTGNKPHKCSQLLKIKILKCFCTFLKDISAVQCT
ncbi:hypothetical protein R3I94_018612 [Phoxinus phoxinus]